MSRILDHGLSVDDDPFAGKDLVAVHASTEAQREIWATAGISDLASCAFNTSISLSFDGRLDGELLAASMLETVGRHEALRSAFNEDGTMVTVVASTGNPLVVHEAGSSPEPLGRALEEYLDWDTTTAFDLRGGPLFRCALLRGNGGNHVLVLSGHGILFDTRSLSVILRDLGELYTARLEAREPKLGMAARFSEFAENERDSRLGPEADAGYWRGIFPELPPDLELPTDSRRPSERSYSAGAVACLPDAQVLKGLGRLGSTCETGAASVLLAAYMAFLSRLTGKPDIVVAVPIEAGPGARLVDMVGLSTNLLPIRATVGGDTSFVELHRHVEARLAEAALHPGYSRAAILRDLGTPGDSSRLPLASAAFSYSRALAEDRPRFGELRAVCSSRPPSSAVFEMELAAVEGPDGLELSLRCNDGLFARETMLRRARELETLMGSLCLHPEGRLEDMNMLPGEERDLVLRGWNRSFRKYPAVEQLHHIYEKHAAAMPQAVAISDSSASHTHREFAAWVECIRRSLGDLGIGPGDRVGVYMRRSIEMVAALHGIVASGAAYVPLDPEYPITRLKTIVEDAGITTICSHACLPDPGLKVKNLILVDELAGSSLPPRSRSQANGSPEDTAYVIYTSGSTGAPKGVEISHRSIANRLYWMQEAFALTGADRVLQKTPFTFDVSVWEFFWPLLFGSTLVVAPPDIHRDARALVDFIVEQSITILHFVPSMLEAFLEEPGARECASIRSVICSGEALPVALCRRCASILPRARIFNLYGPTEAAVDVSWHQFSADESYSTETVPIGVPVANTRLYILDERMEPKVPGAMGELYIAGVQVGKGYLNKPELTSRAFLPDPFVADPAARMYRTGDLARWRHDGSIEYLGRNDQQVKIRGNRVEIGEIEAALQAHGEIQSAVVLAKREASGETRLHAYVVPRRGSALDAEGIRGYLAKLLPPAMIPSGFIFIGSMPLTMSGKTDRKALLELPTQAPASKKERTPVSDSFQREILELWSGQLGTDSFGVDHNFFDLGGDSLMAIRIVRRMGIILGKSFPVAILFQYPTVRKLAEYLRRGESQDGASIAERAAKQRSSMPQNRSGAGARLD